MKHDTASLVLILFSYIKVYISKNGGGVRWAVIYCDAFYRQLTLKSFMQFYVNVIWDLRHCNVSINICIFGLRLR